MVKNLFIIGNRAGIITRGVADQYFVQSYNLCRHARIKKKETNLCWNRGRLFFLQVLDLSDPSEPVQSPQFDFRMNMLNTIFHSEMVEKP